MHPIADRVEGRVRGGGAEPVSDLIVDEIWVAVVEGDLGSGDRLPTVREMAVRLGVTPRTVERAYQQLEDRGVAATRAGEGTFISLRPPPEEDLERHRRFATLCRQMYQSARELGFTVDDLIDSLAEFRSYAQTRSEED
jgi:GntR family transcriptional regulator